MGQYDLLVVSARPLYFLEKEVGAEEEVGENAAYRKHWLWGGDGALEKRQTAVPARQAAVAVPVQVRKMDFRD